jgi:dimethylglycine dehydrogenase
MTQNPQHKSLIIIGGGAMGTSLLYHLAKLGWQDLLLLEKNELTAGSTWHAAGLCTHFAHNPTIMQMRAYSADLYGGKLAADTGLPVSFHQCGALRITRSTDRMQEFRQVQGLGEFLHKPFHIIKPEDLSHLYPLALQGDGIVGGIHEPWDGYVDPTQATHAMAAGARQRGAQVMRHTQVTHTQQATDGSWIVTTNKGVFSCQHLVNAAGTWGYEIGQMMGVDLPMVPMLHQYLVTDDIDEVAARDTELPMIRDPEESWYLRQEGQGYIFGTYEEAGIPWSIDQVPGDFGMELLPPDLDAMLPILEKAMARVPALETAGIKTIVNGPITFTPDAAPLIGPAYGLRNAWLLTGSSMGVMEGGGAGHFLAEWIDKGAPPYDAHAVDSRRYGDFANGDYRVTKAIECFGRQFALHYPVEHLPAGRDQRLSPLHDTWLKAGAIMADAYGWERADYFSSQGATASYKPSFDSNLADQEVARECHLAQTSLAFADLTLFSKFMISGTQADAFMAQLAANRAPSKDGKISLMHTLTSAGGVELEFTVTRLAANKYYLNSAAAAQRIAMQSLTEQAHGWQVNIEDITDKQAILGVFGPQAVSVLEQASQQSLQQQDIAWLNSGHIEIGGHNILALRLSYIGEAGFELHLAMAQLPAVYAALVTAADSLSVEHGPIGMFAINAMRLEKGYPAWGMDLTSERSPMESGLSALVHCQGRSFHGRDALLTRPLEDANWRLGLAQVIDAPGPCFGGQPVYIKGANLDSAHSQAVGIISSGAYGHRCQQNLAMVWLRQSLAKGAQLEVKRLGQTYDLNLIEKAPYDADNARLKA